MGEAQINTASLEGRMHIELARYRDHTLHELPSRAPERPLSREHRIFGQSRPEPAHELAPDDDPHTAYRKEEKDETNLVGDHIVVANLPEQEEGYVSVGLETSPENPSLGSRRPSSPSKHDFQYGGFVESPATRPAGSPSPSLPFSRLITFPILSSLPPTEVSLLTIIAPNDYSSSNHLSATDDRRLYGRSPLPRSPLFISQNLSSSPDRRQTAALTPRVTSRVATHNTPGIIFSQPARRPPRHSATNFRHQNNSFSFDSSERASAAYEQRVSSSSTTESVSRPPDDLNLHEELQGRSLQESSSDSEPGGLSSSEDSLLDHSSPHQDEQDQSIRSPREFIFSSPQLPLPPPFSAASRTSSGAGVLPSFTSPAPPHPPTSPMRSSSSTPVKAESIDGDYGAQGDAVIVAQQEATVNSPIYPLIQTQIERQSLNGSSPESFLKRAVRVFSAYRSRTPSNHGSPNHPSPSPSPKMQRTWSSRVLGLRTPSSSYAIYDDSRPAYSQPQTPAQLPEARHQSRFHPSMTAPVGRSRAVSEYRSIRADEHEPANRRQLSFATPSRREAGRTNSPAGLRTRGFEGLYGGRENGDEEQNWADGVRFNNVGVRLWGLRDARNDGRSMRETPEPEDWRVGQGN